MSRISLEGNASGTGTFTLASPNSSTDRTLDLPDASGVIDRLNRAGNVLQVVSTTKTDTFSTTSTSFTDITGLSASITPTSASSKILVLSTLHIGRSGDATAYVRLLQGSTAIAIGDAAGSRTRATGINYTGGSVPEYTISCVSTSYLDSPATTSSTTYKFQLMSQSGGVTCWINRTNADPDSAVGSRFASTITLLEIAG